MSTRKRLYEIEVRVAKMKALIQEICGHSFKFNSLEMSSYSGRWHAVYVCSKCEYCKRVALSRIDSRDAAALKQLKLI